MWRTLSGVAFSGAMPPVEPVPLCTTRCVTATPRGKHHSETKTRLVDAERRKAEIEVALATATWRDPRRGELSLAEWAHSWLPARLDLRPTTSRFAGGRAGRATINGFQAELRRLGVVQKHSRPNHPTTCGKVERF